MARIRTRVFQSWFRLSRPMTLGVRAVVENQAGKVFMIRHTYTPGWYLPGGGVEKAETSLESLERELLEEGGFRLTAPPDLIGIYSNHFVFPNDHVVLYRACPGTWTQGEATSRGEIAEAVWADPLAPPEGTTPGTFSKLQEIYAKTPPSPYWAPER
jgi:8-oxo-dGTP pyrophosphatase MutT (NUDIX family)